MPRATLLYLLVIVAMIGGLWGMVRLGSRMTAPRDVSGTWQIENAPPRAADSAPAPPTLGPLMRIEQSGQYFRVTFDRGPTLDLIWRNERQEADGGFSLEMADSQWSLSLQLPTSGERVAARLTGPLREEFSAHWLSRETAVKPSAQRLAQAEHTWLHRLLDSQIALLIAQVSLILAASRLMGVLFSRLHQPQVVGEMIAGIMLGPSLFGLLFPVASAALFPQGGLANLNTLSQVGVIFFLFLVGLELDPRLIRSRGHAAVVISHVSIVAPFLLGAGLTLFLYLHVFNSDMRFLSVCLFMGASMSITAFPVLARILTERSLHKTPVGAIAITCAAVDDVTAWCLLAFVVAVARATGVRPALMTAAEAVAYVLIMFFVIRPFLRRLQAVHDRQGLSQNVVAAILLLTLGSAFATESIGIHALFGAFLMGAIMPKGTQFVRSLTEKLEDFTVVFLLPLFFAYTGLKTQIGLLNHASLWGDTILIILVACLGKFGGSTLAARTCGINWRESSIIGILMNTRGLMELVILNIGQDLGVITPAVFAMMVIMALVTTAMTTPILQALGSARLFGTVRSSAGRAPRRPGLFSVLIPVADPRSGGPLLRMARNLAGSDAAGGRIVALHLSHPPDRDAYRTGLREAASEQPPDPLKTLLNAAANTDISVKPLAFVTRDVPADITRVATEEEIDLVLMGFHKSVVGRAFLGGTVHRVLSATRTHVAVFIDRGFTDARKILVPSLGGAHDRQAIALAARLAKNAGARITILRVVDPDRADPATSELPDDLQKQESASVEVVEDISPVDVVLRMAADFDLVIIGISEKWGLSSHLFGWRPERIAQGCPVSLLVVRQFDQPPADDAADEGALLPPAVALSPATA